MIRDYVEQFKGIETSGPVVQFIKYGLAGGIATVVHIFVFHLVAWKVFPSLGKDDFVVVMLGLSVVEVDVASRSINSMLSNFIAFICGNFTAYILNILYVFKAGRHNRFVEIVLFYLVSGTSALVGTALMGLLIRLYGLQTTYAFVANMVSAVAINYVMRKYFIFKG